jgi:signal transduction histidine kinase
MTARLRPGLSIFWQTLLLLLASVAAVFVVTILLFTVAPPPRPDFNSLSDIAEALAGRRLPRERIWQAVDLPDARHEAPAPPDRRSPPPLDDLPRDRLLGTREQAAEPRPDPEMIESRRFSRRLADRIGVSPDRVRLYFGPDQRIGIPFRSGRERRVIVRRGEPLFFDTVLAGYRTDAGTWRVVRTPPRPIFPAWQQRILLLFGLSLLAVIPFAWLFARALAKPIRRIADAADRMGANPQAPLIVEEGPAELRVTAHALNRMQERLSAYLTERTNMIGAIAHDLRTPLARIAFRIEAAPDEMRQKVQSDIEQMRAMIAATISFVRDTGGIADMRSISLDRLVRELVEAEGEIGRAVSLSHVDSITLLGDPMALRRLVQNLVDNAIVYGGSAELSVRRDSDVAEIRVADRGPGLSPAALESMFRPFERGEPSRNRSTGGIGLGLSISRAIAQEHGGTLVLANRDGGGLEALFRMPIRN